MSKILELQQKAQSLQDEHQKNIEEKLQKDIKQIFSDTERTLSEKALSLSNSIDSTKQNLQEAHNQATTQFLTTIKTSTKALLQAEQVRLKQIEESFKQSNHLSQEIVKHSNLRNILLKSNIVLISVAFIALILVIAMSVISYVKYTQIKERNQHVARIDNAIQVKTQELMDLYTQIHNASKNHK